MRTVSLVIYSRAVLERNQINVIPRFNIIINKISSRGVAIEIESPRNLSHFTMQLDANYTVT